MTTLDAPPNRHVERLTSALLFAMIVGGVALRIQGIASPPWFTFDEHAFVPQAHRYGLGLPDLNDHPPGGKLLMLLGMLLFGNNSLGWRFMPLVLGIHAIVLAFWLGRAAFGRARAGLFAAAFVAADGFFIAYSRVALLDGMMLTFVLWALVFAFEAAGVFELAICVLLVGIAMSIKWIAIATIAPAALIVLARRRVAARWLPLLLAAPAFHIALWMGAAAMTGQPHSAAAVLRHMGQLYEQHLALGKREHDLATSFYHWPLLYRPLILKAWSTGTHARYTTTLSNLVLFATVTVVALGAPILAGFRAIRTSLRELGQPLVLLWLGWLAFLAPWVLTLSTRGKYTFHHYYLPSYALGLVALAGMLAKLEHSRSRTVLAYVAVVFTVSLFYAPVWGDFALTDAQLHHRLFLPNWRALGQ